MLENKWAGEYLRSLYKRMGKSHEDLEELVRRPEFADTEDPCLEIYFVREAGSAVKCLNLAIETLFQPLNQTMEKPQGQKAGPALQAQALASARLLSSAARATSTSGFEMFSGGDMRMTLA